MFFPPKTAQLPKFGVEQKWSTAIKGKKGLELFVKADHQEGCNYL